MITFSRAVPEQLLRWSQAASPHEACGLLFGETSENHFVVKRALLAKQTKGSVNSFVIPPTLLLTHAEDPSWIGLWHSHPNGPPALSEEDRQGAEAWPRLLQCLVLPPGTILLFSPLTEGLSPLPWCPERSPRLPLRGSTGVVGLCP